MVKKTIIVSDLTGAEIRDEKEAAQMIIRYADPRRGEITLDVLASEVEHYARKGQEQARPHRRRDA
jgi:hypothetical protein